MSTFSAQLVSADCGYNVHFTVTTPSHSFNGIFYRADAISLKTWEEFPNLAINFKIKSSSTNGITDIHIDEVDSGKIITFILCDPTPFAMYMLHTSAETPAVLQGIRNGLIAAMTGDEGNLPDLE